jgi:hypothetical protein
MNVPISHARKLPEAVMGADWVLLSVVSFLGLLVVAFGVHGFRPNGIPFSPGIRITGVAGKIVGVLCLLLGLAILWAAGRVFGPKEDDAVAHAVVRMFPLGVATCAVAQIVWFLRPRGNRLESPSDRPRSTRPVSRKMEDGFVQCPHCGKRMVDTAQEGCRFCGGDLA